jgi:hypothetical protein
MEGVTQPSAQLLNSLTLVRGASVMCLLEKMDFFERRGRSTSRLYLLGALHAEGSIYVGRRPATLRHISES